MQIEVSASLTFRDGPKKVAIVKSRKAALSEKNGSHHILLVPVAPGNPQGYGLTWEHLGAHRRSKLYHAAESFGELESKRLGNPGAFRIIINGHGAIQRPYYHAHIIAWKPGVEISRATDSILAQS